MTTYIGFSYDDNDFKLRKYKGLYMHSQSEPSANQSNFGFIIRHFFLLIVVILVLGFLYLEFQNMTAVGVAAVLLILAHLGAVALILYGGRKIVRGIIDKIHGQSTPQTNTHDESHHHTHDLETDGYTIGWAWFYDFFVRYFFTGKVKTMMQSTVTLANIQAGEQVLDIGCGTGTLAILAKKTTGQNAEIYGTDASPQMIDRARQKAEQEQVDIDFQTGLAEKIAFPDDTFDLVMNSLMMHHLTAELRQKAIIECYRVIKPGGRLLIVDFEPPKAGLYKSLLTIILGEMTSIDNTTIPPLLEDAGFTNIDIGATDTPIATYVSGVKPIT